MSAPEQSRMRGLVRWTGAICGMGMAALAAAHDAEAGVFNPQSFTLDNGLRVILIEKPDAMAVGHVIYYGVGSADETIGQSGLAHLFEHLQLRGTPAHPDREFSRLIDIVGGEENAGTTWDYTNYYQVVAAEHLPRLMEMEADRMTNTVLTPEVIDTERQIVFEEFGYRLGNVPPEWLRTEVTGALFTRHPYGIPVVGYMDELAAVDYDAIIAFHKRWYTPGNAVVIVTGPVTLGELKVLAEETYGRIPAGETPERVRPAEPEHYAPRTVTLQHPLLGQTSWARNYLTPSLLSGSLELDYALGVLAHVLGGGPNSRLYRQIVLEQGLALSASSQHIGARDYGIFVVTVEAAGSGDGRAALAAIEAAVDVEIARLLEEGVTQAEVDRAITELTSIAVFARDSLMAGPNVIGMLLVNGYTLEQIESFPEDIAKVTAEQVNAAARNVLVLNNSVTGFALPGEP
jgi:zinc protease